MRHFYLNQNSHYTIATEKYVKDNVIYINAGQNFPLTTKLEDVFQYFYYDQYQSYDRIRIIKINGYDYIANISPHPGDKANFDLISIDSTYQIRYSTEYVTTYPDKTSTFADILINTYECSFLTTKDGYATQEWVTSQALNQVTLDTTQTITGAKTFTNNIVVYKNDASLTLKDDNDYFVRLHNDGSESLMVTFNDVTNPIILDKYGKVMANTFSQIDTSKNYIDFLTGTGVPFGIKGNTSTIYDLSAFITTDTNYYYTSGGWSGMTFTLTGQGGASDITFTVPHDSTKQNKLTTSSVSSGTLSSIIGFDSSGNIKRGTIGTSAGGWNYIDMYASSYNMSLNFDNIIKSYYKASSGWKRECLISALPVFSDTKTISASNFATYSFTLPNYLDSTKIQIVVTPSTLSPTLVNYVNATGVLTFNITNNTGSSLSVKAEVGYGYAYYFDDSGNRVELTNSDTIRIYY